MTERFQVCIAEVCPIEDTLAMIGGKWKVIILWWLLGHERRFTELHRALPGVTQKMLTQHLRELESDGLIHREVFPQVPPKVVYSLTPLGESLHVVLKSMFDWSEEHRAEICQAREQSV